MKICYWTNYSNEHHRVLFKALRDLGVDLIVFYFKHYEADRLDMGWKEENDYAEWEHFARTPKEAQKYTNNLSSYHHIITSYFNLTHWKTITYCIRHQIQWSAVLEPGTGSSKTVLHRVLFTQVMNRTGHSLFAISSLAISFFKKQGVKPEKIILHAHATPPTLNPCDIHAPLPLTFTFCGNTIHRKGFDLLIQAFQSVHSEYSKIRLIITGTPPKYPQPGITYKGFFHPKDVDRFLSEAHVLVLPSRFDGWGMAIPEGARNGLALIGTNKTGSALDIIKNGENGFLINANSLESLIKAMSNYAKDPQLAITHGTYAKASIDFTSPHACAQRIISILFPHNKNK